MQSPRLDSTISFRIGGNSSSSIVGTLTLMVRSTAPVRPICTKALTRKRPMPGGAIAKLHSRVASNSLVCRSFMIARTSSCALFWRQRLVRLRLDLAVDLDRRREACGDEEIRPLALDHAAQEVLHELDAGSMRDPSGLRSPPCSARETALLPW
jgi:hypothetical protein